MGWRLGLSLKGLHVASIATILSTSVFAKPYTEASVISCSTLVGEAWVRTRSILAEKFYLGALASRSLSTATKLDAVSKLMRMAAENPAVFFRLNNWAEENAFRADGKPGYVVSAFVKTILLPHASRLKRLDLPTLNGALRHPVIHHLLFRPSNVPGRDLTAQGELLRDALVRLALKAPLFTLNRLYEYKNQELGSLESIFFGEVLRRVHEQIGDAGVFRESMHAELMAEPNGVDRELARVFSGGPILVGVNSWFEIANDYAFYFRTPALLSSAGAYFGFARALEKDRASLQGQEFLLVDGNGYIAARFVVGERRPRYADAPLLSSGRALYLDWAGSASPP